MLHERNCAEQSCGRASVASLSQRDLCLEHFLFSCYENLERLDPRAAASALTPSTWLPCELSSKSVPARRSTSVSIPRILIISDAAAFWTSCSGPANSSFSCEPPGSPSTNLLGPLKHRLCRGQERTEHHSSQQRTEWPGGCLDNVYRLPV